MPATRLRPGSRRPPVARRAEGAAAAPDDAGDETAGILYWPSCGHGLEDDEVLYDRPVCIVCEAC